MSQTIKVNMLGEFTVSVDGKVVLKDEGRSRKVWNLFAFLLANRSRTLAGNELPELLCKDERSDDPAKAVKNLAYRLRQMLAGSDLPKGDWILQKGGTYHWNNGIPLEIDTEIFEEKMKLAKAERDDEKKALALYMEAVDEYGGIFLPGFAYEEWALTFGTRFQHGFVECLAKAHELTEDTAGFERLARSCEKAINFDPYDEKVYQVYIDSLIRLDRQNDALAAYETISDRLFNEMGVNPSKELSNLYRQIIKTIKNAESDLTSIKEGLNEGGTISGAYCSDYEIFKDVYRFVARGVERSGASNYIMLCTVTDQNEEIPEQEYLVNAMGKLQDVISQALRKGDLFARFSASQFVIMLQNLNYENGMMVGNRIMSAYKKHSISRHAKLQFKLQPLDPSGKADNLAHQAKTN